MYNLIEGELYGDGNMFIRLVDSHSKARRAMFKCKCGKEFETMVSRVLNGVTKGCGCLIGKHIDNMGTHGLSHHKLFGIYNQIMSRCYNENHDRYEDWGGRGVKVSEEFKDNPKAFIEYIESLPNYVRREELNLSLDRENNNGNYERGNLRWVTKKEQSNNRRVRKDSITLNPNPI